MESQIENKQPLLYEILGPMVLKDRVPLFEVVGTLTEYMNIIDRSYLTVSGKERLTKKEREKYKIIAYKFNPGSLQIDLTIELFEVFQNVFPFMMPAGAIGLWNIAKSSYDFVKIITEWRSRGVEPVIKEDNSVRYYFLGDKNQILVNPNLQINAEKIEESVEKLGRFIKPGEIEQVSLREPDGTGIIITEAERQLFSPETEISKEIDLITARIYRLDVESRKGKLRILDGMEPRDIAFQILGDQAIGPYIDALKRDKIELRVLRETAISPMGKEYLKRLLVLGIPGSTNNQRLFSME